MYVVKWVKILLKYINFKLKKILKPLVIVHSLNLSNITFGNGCVIQTWWRCFCWLWVNTQWWKSYCKLTSLWVIIFQIENNMQGSDFDLIDQIFIQFLNISVNSKKNKIKFNLKNYFLNSLYSLCVFCIIIININ